MTSVSRNSRASNMELLRIVAMLMIVVHHVITHGIQPVASADDSFFLGLLDSFVIFGVNLFVMISGYFHIRLSWWAFLKLMWIIAFYKIFHLIVDTSIFNLSHPWYEWILKPLSGPVSGGGWFVDVYVLLMLVSPLLNKLLDGITKKDYLTSLCVLLLFDVGYAHILGKHFDPYGYGLLHFIVLYFIGHGVRMFQSIKTSYLWWLLTTSLCISFAVKFFPVVYLKSGGYNNPFVLISSYCIFSLFAKLNIGTCKPINFIAASMLPVYLIHEGGNVSQTFYNLIGHWWMNSSVYVFCGKTTLLVLILFLFAIAIDQPRKLLQKMMIQRQ